MHYWGPDPDVETDQLSIVLVGKMRESRVNTSVGRKWKFLKEIPQFEPRILLL